MNECTQEMYYVFLDWTIRNLPFLTCKCTKIDYLLFVLRTRDIFKRRYVLREYETAVC